MKLLRRTIPLFICFTVGILAWAQYYVPHSVSVSCLGIMSGWQNIIVSVAFLSGLAGLFSFHYRKIKKGADGWGFSLFVFAGFIAGFLPAVFSRGATRLPDGTLTAFGWVYGYVYGSLSVTMFSMLAFYVVSAVFRSFRVKSGRTFALFLSAVIVMLGNVPFVQLAWGGLAGWVPFGISDAVEWIMNVPSVGARRGIMTGIAFGAIATSLKIIIGMEKRYMVGD